MTDREPEWWDEESGPLYAAAAFFAAVVIITFWDMLDHASFHAVFGWAQGG